MGAHLFILTHAFVLFVVLLPLHLLLRCDIIKLDAELQKRQPQGCVRRGVRRRDLTYRLSTCWKKLSTCLKAELIELLVCVFLSQGLEEFFASNVHGRHSLSKKTVHSARR